MLNRILANKLEKESCIMKLEEELLRLNEEELFGTVKSIPVEQSEVLKNFALLSKSIREAIDTLTNRDNLLYEDAEQISSMQNECMKCLGEMQEIIEKYM